MPRRELHHHNTRSRATRKHDIDASDYGSKQLEVELARQGLYIKDITGDGNCLFRSLADQLGELNAHQQIRHDVVRYLREHEDEYRHFIEEDFGVYVDRMGNDGVYGDNLEIVAFARSYQRDVKVYQPGLQYVVQATDGHTSSEGLLHIAYFSWEHYASIRNKDGPHQGPSEVRITPAQVPEISRKDDDQPSGLEKICLSSVPGAKLEKVRDMMKECGGNINEAIERLLDMSFEDEEPTGSDQEEHDEIKQENVSTPIATPKHMSAKDRKETAKRKQKEAARARRKDKKFQGSVEQAESHSKIRTTYI